MKRGKAEFKSRSKSGLKKGIAQTRQGDQGINQKRLKVWLKKLLAMLKS